MSKPVTGQTTFGSNTSGTTTQLDNNFLLAYNALNDLNSYPNFLTDTGSANTVIVTLGANLTGALTNGLVLQIKVAATNTGAATLNYNAGGALNILNTDGTVLGPSQLAAGGIYDLAYRASDTSWLLMTPTGTTASGGGSLVLLQSNAAANSNQVFFNNVLTSAYDNYLLKVSGVKCTGNNSQLTLLVGTGNTPTFQNANYQWTMLVNYVSGGAGNANSASVGATGIFLTNRGLYNGANAAYTADLDIAVLQNANAPAQIILKASYLSGFNNGDGGSVTGGGFWNSNTVITSLQIVPSNGNITSGNMSLYGVRRA